MMDDDHEVGIAPIDAFLFGLETDFLPQSLKTKNFERKKPTFGVVFGGRHSNEIVVC